MKQTRLLHRPFWLSLLFIFVVFWLIALLTATPFFLIALRILLIFVALAVVLAFMREAWIASWKQQLSSEDWLVIGIWLSWATTFVQGMYILLWRESGEPAWMVNTDFNGLFPAGLTVAAALHLLAPGAINGQVPRKNTIRLALTVSLAIVVAFVLFNLQPRLDCILVWLKPKLDFLNRDFMAPR